MHIDEAGIDYDYDSGREYERHHPESITRNLIIQDLPQVLNGHEIDKTRAV